MDQLTGLFESIVIILDANGNGSTQAGPSLANQYWNVTGASVTCTGTLPTNGTVPSLILSINGVVIDSTYSIQLDSSNSTYPVYGKTLICTVANGPAHGSVTTHFTGTINAV